MISQSEKDLSRVIIEFEAMVLLSNHCFICLQKAKERKVILLNMTNPLTINKKLYSRYAIPICASCALNKFTRRELIKYVECAAREVPFELRF